MAVEQIKLNGATSISVPLGSEIKITSTGGDETVAYTTTRWACNGHTGSASTGPFIFEDETWEPYAPNATSMTVTFTMTSYDSDDMSLGTSTATCTLTIPDKYSPVVYFNNITYSKMVNGHIRSGGIAHVTYTVDEPGSATKTVTITDIVSAASITPVVTASEITINLPTISAPSYTVAFKIKVTDSRGRTNSALVSADRFGKVYTYDAAGVNVISIKRCDSDGVEKPNGKNAIISGSIEDTSTPYSFKANWLDKSKNITVTGGNFYVIIGNDELDLGVAYNITLEYISNAMHTAGITEPITVAIKLDAQKVPLSLIDDGYLMGASIGEMADSYNDISSDAVLNLGIGSEMRGHNGTNSVVQPSYDVIDTRRFIIEEILHNLKFIALSQSQYDAIRDKDYSTVYIIY